MKICIVGPGYMSIPPRGWGAVEILIDDYRKTLQQIGHQVEIVNSRDLQLAVWMINSIDPDFVHIQYEEYAGIAKFLNCKHVAVTSHYAYLEQPDKWNPGYQDIFWHTVNSSASIFALSEGIADIYVKAGVPHHKVKVTPNGVRTDLYRFEEKCKNPNESIYLAKIENRKRQTLAQGIEGIKFVGNFYDSDFDINDPNYLGEWDKGKLYENLTQFSNLVLLSDGEAHPLVCMEALAAGLGLVLSDRCTANLDLTKKFITVIPENRISDREFVRKCIIQNRNVSVQMRKEIRDYAFNCDWKTMLERFYIPSLEE